MKSFILNETAAIRELTAPMYKAYETNKLECGIGGISNDAGPSSISHPQPQSGIHYPGHLNQQESSISLKDLKNDPVVQSGEGFCIAISLHDGTALHVTSSVTKILGYPKDMLIGQCILNYLYPRDRLTFASHLSEGLQSRFAMNHNHLENKIVFYCRIRKYVSLKSGFGISDKKAVYVPFQLTCFTRDVIIEKEERESSKKSSRKGSKGSKSGSKESSPKSDLMDQQDDLGEGREVEAQEQEISEAQASETKTDSDEEKNAQDTDQEDEVEPMMADSSSDVVQTICFIASATPIQSIYRVPDESVPAMNPFCTRHTSSCHFSHFDASAIPYLGYLPQDLVGYSIFEFYHLDDLPLLRDIYELVMREQGSTFRSKPYRFRAFNGDYVTLDTEWSCFINPWSKRLESVIGQHRILNGPTNTCVFDANDDAEPEQMLDDSKRYQTEIKSILSQPVKKMSTAINDSRRKRRLAAFVSNIIDNIEGGVDAVTALKECSCSDLGSVVMGEISPHRDDSEPSEETPPSNQEMRLQDNIQRFFASQPKTNCGPPSSLEGSQNSQNHSPDGTRISASCSQSHDSSSSNPKNGSSVADSGLGASGDGNGNGSPNNETKANQSGSNSNTDSGSKPRSGTSGSNEGDSGVTGRQKTNSETKKSQAEKAAANKSQVFAALTEDILTQHNKATLKQLRNKINNPTTTARKNVQEKVTQAVTNEARPTTSKLKRAACNSPDSPKQAAKKANIKDSPPKQRNQAGQSQTGHNHHHHTSQSHQPQYPYFAIPQPPFSMAAMCNFTPAPMPPQAPVCSSCNSTATTHSGQQPVTTPMFMPVVYFGGGVPMYVPNPGVPGSPWPGTAAPVPFWPFGPHNLNHSNPSQNSSSGSYGCQSSQTPFIHPCCPPSAITTSSGIASQNTSRSSRDRKSTCVQTENSTGKCSSGPKKVDNLKTGPKPTPPSKSPAEGTKKGKSGSVGSVSDDSDPKGSSSGRSGVDSNEREKQSASSDASFSLSSLSAPKSNDMSFDPYTDRNSSDLNDESDENKSKSSSLLVLKDPPWMEGVDYSPDLIYRYRMATPSLDYILKKDAAKLDQMRQPALVKKQLRVLNEELAAAAEDAAQARNGLEEQDSPSGGAQRVNNDGDIVDEEDLHKPGPSSRQFRTVIRPKSGHGSSISSRKSHLKFEPTRPSLGFDILEEEVSKEVEKREEMMLHMIGADDDNL